MEVNKSLNIQEIVEKYIHEIKSATHDTVICEHVWWTAIIGSVPWKWDIDIQIRVTQDEFLKIISALKTLYTIKRSELWSDTFAIFKSDEQNIDGEIIPIDLIVVVIGSDYDYFHLIRDAISNNPEFLSEYNAIKQQYNPKSIVYLSDEYTAYSQAKVQLYKKICATTFDKIFS